MYGLVTLLLMLMLMLMLTTASHAAVTGPDTPRPDPNDLNITITDPIPVTPHTSDVRCYSCHGEKGFSIPLGEGMHTEKRPLYVDREAVQESVHGQHLCVECHRDITLIPHRPNLQRSVNCVACHNALRQEGWGRRQGNDPAVLKTVLQNIAFYMESLHARTGSDGRANAGCSDCHGGHAITSKGTSEHEAFRLSTPKICGKCHEKQLLLYEESIHGVRTLRYDNREAAVCADCHTAHRISSPHQDPGKLIITRSCGNCHDEAYESYTATYHGQVNVLGYTHTAKCFDCHSAHSNRRVSSPDSPVSEQNRDKTCMKCHPEVSPGFLTFLPHGNTHDFDRYPEMWLASKFMIALLIGVFLFFWTHSALWFFRASRDSRDSRDKSPGQQKRKRDQPSGFKTDLHVRRFPSLWRLAHLLFALSIMTLAFTGMTVLYSDSFWAPWAARILGGAEMMATLHRGAAILFATLFFAHLIVVLYRLLWRDRKTFRWFGPTSLLPRRRDFKDFAAMVRWFFGKGAQPTFDHWTYWEKFDYWAPFWGMLIIGLSGLVLWFPKTAGDYFPGWIFNVATIVHGEEAFLAVVFIFTVHFFNCHFRPGKFPLDITMFVGRVPIETFREEHADEYRRLKKEGRLEAFLTPPPTPRQILRARILGFTLIAIGLILLFITLAGFTGHLLR